MVQETLLVPLDGSAASEAAIGYAVAIAKAEHAGIRLFRSVEDVNEFPLFETAERDASTMDALQVEAARYLGQRATSVRAQGVTTSIGVGSGNTTEEILRAAEAAGVSTIVMATHGRGGLQRWAIGSVADKVMRMGAVPTLLVRPPETATSQAIDLRTLLLPLDGSPLAETAIEPAVALAKATGAELLVLRVEPWVSQSMALAADGMYIPDLGEIENDVEASAKEYVKGICARLPDGVRYRGFIERGFVYMVLEPFITEQHVDLVVMSTHGRGGLTRLVIGSTADRLVRDGVPCLLIRPKELHEQHAAPVAGVAAGR